MNRSKARHEITHQFLQDVIPVISTITANIQKFFSVFVFVFWGFFIVFLTIKVSN